MCKGTPITNLAWETFFAPLSYSWLGILGVGHPYTKPTCIGLGSPWLVL